jgi:hypothetical protein
MIFKASNTEDQKQEVQRHCKGGKVLDVGGAMNQWLRPPPYGCIDIQKGGESTKNWIGDINMPMVWKELLRYVSDNGRFDFAVCTHVLEDIRNPPMVLMMLPLVAEEGFISMPNKYWELGYVENTHEKHYGDAGLMPGPNGYTYRGFHHHRWIYTVKEDNTLWAFPKLSFIDYIEGVVDWIPESEVETRGNMSDGGDVAGHWHELSFWWAEDIPYKIVNDDFLGPSPNEVFQYYRDHLKEGL